MSTILEYSRGCQYYSDRKIIEVSHLCDEHKLQAFNDALKDFIKTEIHSSESAMEKKT